MGLLPPSGNPANLDNFGVIDNNLIALYNKSINTLLADCTCTVVCELIYGNCKTKDCDNCAAPGIWSPDNGMNCPACLGKRVIEQTNLTETINMLVIFSPRDFQVLPRRSDSGNDNIKNEFAESMCRAEYAPALMSADFIRIDSCNPCNMLGGNDKWKRITNIVKCGLGGGGSPFIIVGWRKELG